jgi:hypothetical protein
MGWLRQRVVWIACGWLCCHLSVLVSAQLSLVTGMSHAADSISCTCVHGGNGQCPMHHPANPKPDCQCRSTADPDAAALVTLLGPVAVLAATSSPAALLPITEARNHQITRFTSITTSPDGPPPRA